MKAGFRRQPGIGYQELRSLEIVVRPREPFPCKLSARVLTP